MQWSKRLSFRRPSVSVSNASHDGASQGPCRTAESPVLDGACRGSLPMRGVAQKLSVAAPALILSCITLLPAIVTPSTKSSCV